ncbi:unnamed protein product, partial [Allacma fusca]
SVGIVVGEECKCFTNSNLIGYILHIFGTVHLILFILSCQ